MTREPGDCPHRQHPPPAARQPLPPDDAAVRRCQPAVLFVTRARAAIPERPTGGPFIESGRTIRSKRNRRPRHGGVIRSSEPPSDGDNHDAGGNNHADPMSMSAHLP